MPVLFEEVVLMSRSIGMLHIAIRIEGREERETEAAIILVFEVDDRLVISQQLTQLAIRATVQR